MPDNFERMLELVGEAFDTRNDPDQISVTPEEQELLALLHMDTLSELANDDGPIVWILLVPTTRHTMDRFLANTITEKQLLHETLPGGRYDALYLCSATALPEFRGKGLAKKLCLEAIGKIREDHPIADLFYWPFSKEGRQLAEAVARKVQLPLHEKE